MTAPDMEPLLTRAEVAAMFRVHPNAVSRWVRDGKLKPVPGPGKRPRFNAAEVRALLAGTEES